MTQLTRSLNDSKEKYSSFILFITLLVCCILQSCNKERNIDYTVRVNAVKTAFENKSIDSLRPYLANGYTVKGLPEGMESILLSVLLKKLPAPKKFVINTKKTEKRGVRLHVTFYDSIGKPLNANFLVAKDGKFLELNILEDAEISEIQTE